ncbi:MAG: GntR family transcriptional regulator [Pseudomonadota bacterium]|nr:GntR family transcriptional regulator [Pseudomonadota bacterium]
MSSDAARKQKRRESGVETATGPVQDNSSARTPLYLALAHDMESRIRDGRLPLGSLLPPEPELAAEFGVSRHTLRQAIQRLRRLGLVSAKKGVGTTICEADASSVRRFVSASRADLSEQAEGTDFAIFESGVVRARGALASELACRPGREWFTLKGTRSEIGADCPMALDEVYVDPRLAETLKAMNPIRQAIFRLVEEVTGERIAEIRQTIRPVILDRPTAEVLNAQAGEPALKITRAYFSPSGRLLELSHQTLPADRFAYTTVLRDVTA